MQQKAGLISPHRITARARLTAVHAHAGYRQRVGGRRRRLLIACDRF
jgi:hypothetical protein